MMTARRRPLAVTLTAVAGCLLIGAVTANQAAATAPRPADTAPCGGEVVVKADGTQWQCTFDDEFDGTALDGSKWIAQLTANSRYTTGPSGSQACYVDSTNNISVSGGYLSLIVRHTNAPFTCTSGTSSFSTQYTSGMVISKSKFAQEYGRFEVRAKLPQWWDKGLQETLWLYPTDATKYGSAWPHSGEIDFAEMFSSKPPNVIPYIHYVTDPGTQNTSTNTNVVTAACPIQQSQFNTYAVVWEPGTLTIYANNHVCLTDNYAASGLTSPAPFDQKFFLALTQALGVGSNAFTPGKTKLPATTQIDYVRVWS